MVVKVGEIVLCLDINLHNDDKLSGCYGLTLLGQVYWPHERFCWTSVLKITSNGKPNEIVIPYQDLIQSEEEKSLGISGVPAVPLCFPSFYLALHCWLNNYLSSHLDTLLSSNSTSQNNINTRFSGKYNKHKTWWN